MAEKHILKVFGLPTFHACLDLCIKLDILPAFTIFENDNVAEFEFLTSLSLQKFVNNLEEYHKSQVLHVPPETAAPPPSPSRI